jgi:hypothetical protein
MSTGTPDASRKCAQGSLINPPRSCRHECGSIHNNTGDAPSPTNINGGPLQANDRCNKRKDSAADPLSLVPNDNTCYTNSFNHNKRSCTQYSSNQRDNTTLTGDYPSMEESTSPRKRKAKGPYSTSFPQVWKWRHGDFKQCNIRSYLLAADPIALTGPPANDGSLQVSVSPCEDVTPAPVNPLIIMEARRLALEMLRGVLTVDAHGADDLLESRHRLLVEVCRQASHILEPDDVEICASHLLSAPPAL